MKKAIPKCCRSCRYLHTGGIKDNIHNKWCCRFGAPTWKIIGHCKLYAGWEPLLNMIKEIEETIPPSTSQK